MRKPSPVYKINQISDELGISIQTVKNYEAQGILPKAKRDDKGWRYYTQEDFIKIKAFFQEEVNNMNSANHLEPKTKT